MREHGAMQVLVVEDDRKLAELLARRLHALGHEVEIAGDGPSGLERAKTHLFEIALVDVMLPGMDGTSVVRTLRSAGNTLPIIMLTARDTVADRVRGLDAGADDYVVKPFEFEELTARMEAVARRSPAGTRLAHGPLQIDRATRRAWSGDTELDLTPLEFDLLAFLLANAGTVVSRADLRQHVWGLEDLDAPSKVVDLYVYYLRRKLGDAGDLIETVRGIGYAIGR